MNYKKRLLELFITFFISFFIYSLNDFKVFSLTKWDQDRVANLLHTWILFISSYHVYNGFLKLTFTRYKYVSGKTLVLLLVCTSFIVMLWFTLCDLLFYRLYYGISSSWHEQTTFFEFDLPVTLAVLMLGSLFFHQKYYIKPIEKKAPEVPKIERLSATKGKTHLFIDYQDIGLIYIENELVVIQNLKGEKYFAQESLSSIISQLDNQSFFRLNRQVIVSRIVIREYEKLAFQKLRVLLVDTMKYNEPIIVSKYNAPSFKKWLTNSA